MRKFNFNSFKKDHEAPAIQAQPNPKPRFSAYRTIISRHDAVKTRLKDEPVAPIKSE